jgi:hypothetical protein
MSQTRVGRGTTIVAWVLVAALAGAGAAAICLPGASAAERSSDALLIQQLAAQVQALQSREEIRVVMNDYGRLLDKRDFDGFAGLWASQAEYVSGGTVTRGPQAIADSLRDIIGRNPLGFGTPNFHVFFNQSIDVQGERATAVSRSEFVVPGQSNRPEAVILASYDDLFIKQNGRWKFLRRVVHGDIPAPKK